MDRRSLIQGAIAAAMALGLLAALACFSGARATGVSNMLLGAGGGGQAVTVTAGSNVVDGDGAIGYESEVIGSITGGSLPGGLTVITVAESFLGGNFKEDTFIVIGFSADPTQAWLTSLTINSMTFTGTGATYSYNSTLGQATWTWSTPAFGFADGDSYPGTIIFQ